jgi:hypothetical protein
MFRILSLSLISVAQRRNWLVAALIALRASASGSTMVFVPQPDITPGTTNYSWYSAANWFIADPSGHLNPAYTVPGNDDSAVITSLADAEAGHHIRVQNLLLTNNAAVSNGTFSVLNLQMLSASSFQYSHVFVLGSLNVGGTNCALHSSALNLLSIATGTFAPVAPAPSSTLTLSEASVFDVAGSLMLAGGSQIVAGSAPESTLSIEPGGVIISTNLTYIQGSAASSLVVDNGGLIRVDEGTLRFDNGIDWRSTPGLGEFKAASTNSLLLFASGFDADNGTTSLFTGPGTSRWPIGGTIDGAVQVGAIGASSPGFSTGNLEILASCDGSGSMHVLGDPYQGAVLNWSNGMLSVPAINIDAGGTMLVSSGPGTSRQLSGCALNNSGLCSVLGGDLTLAQGTVVQNTGTLSLNDDSRIIGGDLPQSSIVVSPGGVLSSTNLTYVLGSAAGHLSVDNSGLIRAEAGTLSFDNGIDWHCSSGTGEFRAAATNAIILFATGFQSGSGTTSLFTGPGTSRWPSASSIDGTAEIGKADGSGFSPGNLEIYASCSGLGSIHVLGNPSLTGALIWNNGTLSLKAVNIDTNGLMLISGGTTGTSRQLSGCALNNQGLCRLLSGDLGLAQGAAINNLAGGTFEVLVAGIFSGAPAPGGGAFNNSGIFRISGNGTTQFGTTVPAQGPDFNNAGVVDIVSGQLNLMGGVSSGQFQTAGSALLWFWGGTHTLSPTARFTGPGAVRLDQGVTAPQWLVSGGASFSELEVGANGLLVGTTNPPGNPITIGSLVVNANGSISNGTYSVGTAQMLDGTRFMGLTLSVSSNLLISQTNCVLDGTILKVAPSATATFAPVFPATGFNLTLAHGSVLENSGRLYLSEGSRIVNGALPQSSVINKPDAVLITTNQASFEGSAAGHLILDNSGVIRADAGTLRFDNGIDWRCGVGTGEFRAVSTSSQILFASGFYADFGTRSFFTGPGTNRWLGASTIHGTAQVGARDPGTLVFTPGNLEILASASGLGIIHLLGNASPTAVLNWANGTLNPGALNIDTNAVMLISGGAAASRQFSGGTINNQGRILLRDQAAVTCGSGATLNNLPGGVFDIQTDAALTFSNAAPRLVINNAGSLLKSAGTQATVIAADLNNTATIDLKVGTLQFQGSWSQTAGITTVEAGTVLGGTLLNIGGGTLTGTGTIQAAVVNSGVTSPGGSPGTLSIGPGQNYQQADSGILRIELGGSNPGTQSDQLIVGGNASLGGTLELPLINGFVPHVGDQIRILTCASLTGQFSQINPPSVNGAVWVAHSSGTNVTLVLANPVSIAKPVLSGGILHMSFATTVGVTYVVQWSESINPSDWKTLEQVPGNGGYANVTDPVINPRRFYRIVMQ